MKTLTKRAHFVEMQKNAQSFVTPGIIVQYRPEEAGDVVVGYTASRKVGGAVQRNFAKRRMRHLARLILAKHDPACFVLIARKDCLTLPFDRLHRDLQWALRRLKGQKKDV
ncbi:MAG: ribonuclease P protein component [Alphaproteobacteria bacterium]